MEVEQSPFVIVWSVDLSHSLNLGYSHMSTQTQVGLSQRMVD